MWIKLIPLVLGIIFLVVSMVIKYNVELRRSICTEQVSAVIAGVTKHNIYDSDGPDTEIYTCIQLCLWRKRVQRVRHFYM